MKKTISITFLYLLIISCSKNEKNTYIIPQKDLIPILCDFHIFDAAARQGLIKNNRNNLIRHKQYKSILSKYKMERTRFDSTINYYSQRPEEHKLLYQKVETQLIKKMEGNHTE